MTEREAAGSAAGDGTASPEPDRQLSLSSHHHGIWGRRVACRVARVNPLSASRSACDAGAMGYLLYDQQRYHFEDRLLVHLRLAIARKFRQHESFFLEWAESPDSGGGRVSLWMDPTHHLGFRFIEHQTAELNLAWVDAMAKIRAPHRGLFAIPERLVDGFMPADDGRGREVMPLGAPQLRVDEGDDASTHA